VPYPDSLDRGVQITDLKARHKATAVLPLLRYLRRKQPLALLPSKYHACMVSLWARRWFGASVPLFPIVHNTLTVSVPQRGRRRQVRRHYGKADGIITVSRGVANDLLEGIAVEAEKVQPIVNPVLTDEVDRRAWQSIHHPWLTETPRPEPVVIGAGRFTPQKDFATLLRALAKLREQRPARLILLGDGEQRQELQSLAASLDIAEAVDLPGVVDDPLPYMARADLFVLSSAHEGLPTVLIEALGAGVPVVSTDCPSGPREILQGGRLGPLTPVGDAAALAEAMAHTLAQPLDAATLRQGADPFFADRVAQQYLRVMGLVESDQ
jgi:glycosyltransferase involved in cell wall biosynthesis